MRFCQMYATKATCFILSVDLTSLAMVLFVECPVAPFLAGVFAFSPEAIELVCRK